MTILVSPGQDKFNTSPSSPSTVYSARVGVRLANGLWRTILYWDKLEGTMVIMVTMVNMVILYWERVVVVGRVSLSTNSGLITWLGTDVVLI